MKTNIVKYFSWLFVLVLLGNFAYGDLYVKSKYAMIRKHPRAKKKQDRRILRNDAIKKLRYRQGWYKVQYKGESGWIYRGKISKVKPRRDQSLIDYNGHYNPKAGEAVAAGSALRILGDPALLRDHRRKRVKALHRKYLRYHLSYITSDKNFTPRLTDDGIEQQQITSEMIEAFLEQGQLGEYNSYSREE